MAWPSNPIDDVAVDALAPAVTRSFVGRTGLAALQGPLSVTAPEPTVFEARLTTVRFAHVALEHYAATAHTVRRGEAEMAAFPQAVLAVVFVLEGQVEVRLRGATYVAGRGESLLMDTRTPADSSSPGPVRLLRSVVGVEHVPGALLRAAIAIPGPLPSSALLTSYRAFASAVLRSTCSTPSPRGSGRQLAASVTELHSAVLAEASQITSFPHGPAALRYRIDEHIQRHHTDPDLDVDRIAHALGVSTGHAHHVYNDADRTIGRVLRDRRADTAAHVLEQTPGTINLQDLARRAGFADRDAMNRAFQSRFGMSVRQYRERRRGVTGDP